MDMFLSLVTLFLVANMAIVFTLLRRIDLNNASVQAWEQAQVVTDVAISQPVYNANLNSELVQ